MLLILETQELLSAPNGPGGKEGEREQLSDFIPASRRQRMENWNPSHVALDPVSKTTGESVVDASSEWSPTQCPFLSCDFAHRVYSRDLSQHSDYYHSLKAEQSH